MVQFHEKATYELPLYSLSQYHACSDILRSFKISFSRFIHAVFKKKGANIRKTETSSYYLKVYDSL